MPKKPPVIDIYLPTYHRPEVLAAVAKNIEQTTKNPFRLYFGVERDDKGSYNAAKATGHQVRYNKYAPGYSGTAQTLYEAGHAQFYFLANDDFVFLPNWDEYAVMHMHWTPDVMVIGLHDGNPDTNYWTISLVRRLYIERQSGVSDMPKTVLYPYKHNFSDTEFTETAIHRGVWTHSTLPCIEHHHPSLVHVYGEPPKDDPTYQKNNATFKDDLETYLSRTHLWR